MPELKLLGGPGAPRTIQLSPDQSEWVLGTGVSCQIVLEDQAVHDRHARIRRSGFGFTIEPIGDGGDLRVNGSDSEGLIPLDRDDEILLGRTRIVWQPDEHEEEVGQEISLDDSISSFAAVPRPSGMFSAMPTDFSELTSDTGAAKSPFAEEVVSGDHLMDAMSQVISALKGGLAVPEIAMASLASAFGADRALLYLPIKGELKMVASFLGPAELGADEGLTMATLRDACERHVPVRLEVENLGGAEGGQRFLMAVSLDLDGAMGILALDAPGSFRVFQQQDYGVLAAFGFNLSYLLTSKAKMRRLERQAKRWSGQQRREVHAPPGGWAPAVSAAIEAAAPSPKPVLILGEPGVGKRLAAAHLHAISGRIDEPCVVVECAATEDAARQLFGFADLSAGIDEPGALDMARRGTLVLAHMTALPMGIQSRLDAYLTSGEYVCEGEKLRRRSGARLVLTSHLDPGQAGGAGWFLEALYKRFKRHRMIRIASLREDQETLLRASRALIEQLARLRKRAAKDLSPAAWELLREYPWSGNYPELHTVLGEAIERSSGETLEASILAELFGRG